MKVKKKDFKKSFVLLMILTIFVTYCNPSLAASNTEQSTEDTDDSSTNLDTILFGDSESESAHDFEEKLSVAGVDDKAETEYTDSDGMLAGGGIGDGLTYRYIEPSPDGLTLDGKLEFTLKADPTKQNYLTIRLSGTQQGRGNLMLYGPDGDTSILDPFYMKKYSELDNGYDTGSAFADRYNYDTYIIPQSMIYADGTVRLCIMSTGRLNAYSTGEYSVQTENSKYIYSASIHTEPYYTPDDDYTGTIPTGTSLTSGTYSSAYDDLYAQQEEIFNTMLSWQLYGDEFDAFKTSDNDFLEGAVVSYTPISKLAGFSGTRTEWAEKTTAKAINYQNWSPLMSTEIFVNAFMNDWSGDYYNSEDLLQRIFAVYDFLARAQDSTGAWCVPTSGSTAYEWIGAT